MPHIAYKKALVIGATGAVGRDLVDQLLQDDAFESVVAFVRRPLAVENPFYTRMKGELEEAVKKLGFPACFILQPPSLVRKGSDRFGEKAGVVMLRAFNAIGLMRAWKPMPTEEVAAAMVRLAKSGRLATETVVAQDILKA